jgi:hypothetical protein
MSVDEDEKSFGMKKSSLVFVILKSHYTDMTVCAGYLRCGLLMWLTESLFGLAIQI